MLTGGCYCGRVRYRAEGRPFNPTFCHCSDCRRIAASPVVAWFSVDRESFDFVSGEPKRFSSSAKAVRSFCPDCGTPLTYESVDAPDAIDIQTLSLDAPEACSPADHCWTAEQLSWVKLSDGLPRHPRGRPGT